MRNFGLRRFILRLVIWIKQSSPLNYVRFLERAKLVQKATGYKQKRAEAALSRIRFAD